MVEAAFAGHGCSNYLLQEQLVVTSVNEKW